MDGRCMQNMHFLETFFSFLEKIDDKLKGKKMTVYSNIAGSLIFIVFSVSMHVFMPSQINITEEGNINARTFPALLLQIMLVFSALLLGIECVKLFLKKPCAKIEIDLLAEIKALVILGSFVLYFVLLKPIGFIASSCIFSIVIMLYFRVKKLYYYLIGIGAGILIGVLFQYILRVRLP